MRLSIFRIFLSSTFGDFQAEREAFRKKVWPKLEQHCKAHGVSFEVVDLRWGISEADGNSHETLRICLDEIANCQQLSPKPNFLLMVGNRYGWRPLPSEIPKEEFDRLLSLLGTCTSDDYKLLMSAYQLDENALPHHYCLKPKGENWDELEKDLSALLKRIGGSDYLLSATHLEIIKGALNGPNVHDHVFGFIRDIEGLDPNSEQSKVYTDISKAGVPDDEASKLLDQLRDKIKTIPEEHRYEHSAQWKQCSKGQLGTEYIEQLCQRVQDFLLGIIDQELNQRISDPFDQELQYHRDFSAERLKMFLGRIDELAKVKKWALSALASNGGLPLIVHGSGGTGKSAFMSKVAAEIEDSQPDTEVIQRFIGASPKSSDLHAFLGDLLREIARRYEQAEALPEGGLKELIEELPKRLSWATSDKPLLLVIDALDQFDATTFEAPHHQWLPMTIPEHVAVVLSVLDGEIANAAISRYPKAEVLQLPPFNREDGRLILDALLLAGERVAPERKRKLTNDQYAVVLNAFEKHGQPLFLSLAAGIVRRWKSWESPESLPDTIEALVERVVKNLRNRHGQIMADRALDYLVASRYGMSDEEILGLLWADAESHKEFNEQRLKTGQPLPNSLPPIIWSRIYFDLATYLVPPQSVDGALLHKFFHRIIGETIAKISLGNDKVLIHERMANYFEKQPLFIVYKQEKTLNLRKLMEEPWHWIQAGRYDKAESILTNFEFAMAKCKANRLDDLLEDFDRLTEAKRQAHQQLSNNLDDWALFLRQNAHILRRSRPEWTADRIFLQLATEHAHESPVTIAAENWLEQGWCDWIWLRTSPKKTNQRILDTVLEGSAGAINGVMTLPDNGLLSWWNAPWESGDKSICLWDTHTGKYLRLNKHSDYVTDVIRIGSDRWLSWSSYPECIDFSLCLWSSHTGEFVAKLSEHRSEICDAVSLSDDKIFSWSSTQLVIWDATKGNKISSFELSNNYFTGVCVQGPGAIICWTRTTVYFVKLIDYDFGFKLESTAQRCLTSFFCMHENDSVADVIPLSETRILIRTKNSNLISWNHKSDSVKRISHGHDQCLQGLELINSKYAFTWSLDLATVWDSKSLKHVSDLAEWTGAFSGISFLPGHRVMAHGIDNVFRVWSLDTGEIICKIPQPKSVRCNFKVFNGETLIIWSDNSQIYVVDLQTNSVRNLEGIKISIGDIFLLRSGDMIALPKRVYSFDGSSRPSSCTLHLLHRETGQTLSILAGHTKPINGIEELSDGKILSWSDDRTIRIWNLSESVTIKSTFDPFVGAQVVCNDYIATWTEDGGFYLFSIDGVGEPLPLIGHDDQILGVLSLSNNKFVTWGDDGRVLLWDTRDSHPAKYFSADLGSDTHARLLANGDVVFFESDHKIFVLTHEGDPRLNELSWCPEGSLAIGDSCDIFLWSSDIDTDDFSFYRCDRDSGKPVVKYSGHSGLVSDVIPLKDRGLVLSYSLFDGTARVWDYQAGTFLVPVHEHEGDIEGIKLLEDGRFFSWSDSSGIILSDTKNNKPVNALKGHRSGVRSVIELPSGDLLSRSRNELIRWDGDGLYPTVISEYPNLGSFVILQNKKFHVDKYYSSRLLLVDVGRYCCDEEFVAHWVDSSGFSPVFLGSAEKGIFPILTSDGRLVFAQLMKGNSECLSINSEVR